MTAESVRIGLRIRESALSFRLHRACRASHPTGSATLQKGEYRATVAESSDSPVFGARLAAFRDLSRAEKLIRYLSSFGVQCSLATLGKPTRWGGRTYRNDIHAVVVGSDDRMDAVMNRARDELMSIPHDPKGEIPGWRRHRDELPDLQPIRQTSPVGGTLKLVRVSDGKTVTVSSPILLEGEKEQETFELQDVRIGIDFHWDHLESLSFQGSLELVVDGEGLTAVNELPLDDYLAAVLGSEMRPDWPVEALAAQAVAARSTVLATRGRHHAGEAFDLCHDDHCQCYQGTSRVAQTARDALDAMPGKLLVMGDRVADARYAKTCGGISDSYRVAWDDEEYSYLTPVVCGPLKSSAQDAPMRVDPDGEVNLNRLLNKPPDWAACNPEAHAYPPSAREMEELYRWQQSLTQHEIRELVEARTGRDIGAIEELVPLEYGVSGRLRSLRLIGSKGTLAVTKELAIRRLLSESHLPSSAFRVHREGKDGFRLEGIGWGHGVGLCQLGSAALADEGWKAEEILAHYYPGTRCVDGEVE